ncbi:MAG: hypothetical protein IPH03_12740 [Tetrasphaera sp.]|nr:hypothetical protein [Tetrasphaera sp.]
MTGAPPPRPDPQVPDPQVPGLRTPDSRSRGVSVPGLLGWILAGLLLTLSVLGMLTIGPFVLPVALGLIWALLAHHAPHARAGGLLGGAILTGWIAWTMRWSSASTCSGSSGSSAADQVNPCRSLGVPWGWLTVTVVLAVGGGLVLARDARSGQRG